MENILNNPKIMAISVQKANQKYTNMDTTKFIDFIPAIIILVTTMIIVLFVLSKFGDNIFHRDYEATHILLFVASFLFIIILVVHLFREQPWTADTLKILIGTILGTSATKFTERKNEGGSNVDISAETVGGDIAGRDINKNVHNIQEAISQIKDSIIHQNAQIGQVIGTNSNTDFLINTVYERGPLLKKAIKSVIDYWSDRGWILKHLSSDYHGMDGIFLVFTKPTAVGRPELYYYHGSEMKEIK